MLSRSGYTYQIDMWSLGVISYILLSGYPPFRSTSQEQSYHLIQKLSSQIFLTQLLNLSADPNFYQNIWKCRSNMTSQHVSYHNEILVIIPRRFIKAGRVWCGDARETWEPRVTIGWLLPLRDIPLNYLPAFQDLNGRLFLKILKGSKSWEKFYTIFRPWVASKINQKYPLFSVP